MFINKYSFLMSFHRVVLQNMSFIKEGIDFIINNLFCISRIVIY